MDKQDERGWVVVGALFATMFLIWGPINASGVFFLPVIKHFGWSRGFFSLLVATAPLAAGLSSPAVGWLIDRIGARQVMIAGASIVALSFLALSRANSAAEFLVVFVLLGVGITASTIIPSALVITNWFEANRGLALGIAFAGIPLGGSGITILANYVVLHYGFRAGYVAMAVPIVLIVLPLLAAFVRTRPDAHAGDMFGTGHGQRDGGAWSRVERSAPVAIILADRDSRSLVRHRQPRRPGPSGSLSHRHRICADGCSRAVCRDVHLQRNREFCDRIIGGSSRRTRDAYGGVRRVRGRYRSIARRPALRRSPAACIVVFGFPCGKRICCRCCDQ